MSIPPSQINKPETVVLKNQIFPKVYARRFNDAIINHKSDAVINNNSIIIPDYYFENLDRFAVNGGNLKSSHKNIGQVDIRYSNEYEKGIGLIGLGSFNWYHWLIEILPRAFMANMLPEKYIKHPFIVPPECNQYSSFRDSLAVFIGDREIISLEQEKQYLIKDYILIDSVVHGPFNMRAGYWPEASDYKQNNMVLNAFREKILESFSIKQENLSGRYFLARGNTRRNYNQTSIENIAIKFGLSVVYPEKLTFFEQVKLFHNAELIVGPSGAAWANSIFCQNGALGLTWILNEYKNFCCYTNLAALSGLNINYIFTKSNQTIKNTGQAYNASYELDEHHFEQALENIIKML